MPAVYEIGKPFPKSVRFKEIQPGAYRLLDGVYLEMPKGVLDLVQEASLPYLNVVSTGAKRYVFAHPGFVFGPSFPAIIKPLTPDVAEKGAAAPSLRHDAGYSLGEAGVIGMQHRAAIDHAWRLDCAASEDVDEGPAKTFIARAWHRLRPWRFWLGVRLGGRQFFKHHPSRKRTEL